MMWNIKRVWAIALASVLIVTLLPMAMYVSPIAAQTDWVIDGDTVYTDDANVYLSATPHTLEGSGWVEFELKSKVWSGEIDVVWGLPSTLGIKPSQPQRWALNVSHERQRDITVSQPYILHVCNISAWTPLEWNGLVPDIGNENNTYIYNITASDWRCTGNSTNSTIYLVAFNSYDGNMAHATVYGNCNVTEQETYYEYYDDWVSWSPPPMQTVNYTYAGVDQWRVVQLDTAIVAGKTYKVRCWIDCFTGLDKTVYKYVWGLKPRAQSIQQAKEAGNLYILDPWLEGGWDYRKEVTVTNANADYQTMQLIAKTSDAVGEDVDCNGHIEDDFDDLRWTESDGTTLVDYWIEEIVDSGGTKLATVWIQNSGDPDTTLYMYYGNSGASAVSSGANTFIHFEDCEWGSNGDPIDDSGGTVTWTIAGGDADISTEQAYGGTRSLKLLGGFPSPPEAYFTCLHSDSIAIRFRGYKENASILSVRQGDGTDAINFYVDASENINYYDGATQDTGADCTADTWELYEFNDFNWGTPNWDIWHEGGEIQADATMWSNVDYDDECRFYGSNTATLDFYVDEVIVRKWAVTEPSFAYGSEEEAPTSPTVATNASSSVETTTATLNGDVLVVNAGWIEERGFVWDTVSRGTPNSTTAPSGSNYTNYWTEGGNWTTGSFNRGISSLSTATTYYARAAAENNLNYWGYGNETSFLTKPAAPTNVAATDGDYTDKVVVTWTKSSGNVTGYKVYRDGGLIDTVGNVSTYDDTGADVPTITPGTASATDGTSTTNVTVSVSGESANNGTTHIYKVRAYNDTGDSADSATDTGYRGVGSLTAQWYRSSGDADSGYSSLAGATTDPYDDTTAPAPTVTAGNATASDGTSASCVTLTVSNQTANSGDGRYYKCELSATGATSQNSTSNRGYRGTTTLTYQWMRSAADSDASYSNISGGITNPYNDTGGVVDPDGRYYKCTAAMLGASSQNSTSDRGYKAAVTTPTVTASNATGVTATGATLHGNVTDTGGANVTMRGFQWGYATGNYTLSWNQTSGDFGIGAFDHTIGSLNTCDQVFWRAFAVNSQGQGNSTEQSFNTSCVVLPRPPTNFTITQAGPHSIMISWTMGTNADTTVVRASEDSYPDTVTDGYEVYSGNETSFTVEGLSFDMVVYYYRAWSHNDYGYSVNYAEANVGNPIGLPAIVFAVGLFGFALWKRGWIRILLAICIIIWGAFAIPYDIKVAAPLLGIGAVLFFMEILRIIEQRWREVA